MKARPSYLSAEELAGIVDARFAALVLYARTWNVDDAEDLVQNALLKLVDQAKRPENPVAWLCKTIRNEAISRHRKAQRRQKHETDAAREKPDWFVPGENVLFAREAAEKLDELRPEQREIVVLRIWSQLSFEEIAELTAMPKTGVFRLYTESLAELRAKLV